MAIIQDTKVHVAKFLSTLLFWTSYEYTVSVTIRICDQSLTGPFIKNK